MTTTCEIPDCTLEKFESETKCILHCDKTIANCWILSEKYTRPMYSISNEIHPIKEWNIEKVDLFWKILFKEVRNAIKLNLRHGNIFENQNPIYAINLRSGKNEQHFFTLTFMQIIFPPVNHILEKYASSNNKWILHNGFQKCTFIDNCVISTNGSRHKIMNKNEDSKQLEINTQNNFYNCKFYQNLIFYRPNSLNEKLLIQNCDIKKGIKLMSSFDFITIKDTKTKGILHKNYYVKEFNLFINDTNNIKNICFENSSIENLKIYSRFKIMKFHKILFKDSKFKKISIKKVVTNLFIINNVDFLEDSKMLFEDIKTKVLKIKRLSQESKYIQFHNITVSSKFECERVEFNNTYFNDFNIENANKKINKTSFIGSHLNSIMWGDISKIDAKQDTFRQLKFVNDSQGNHIDANSFFANEMHKYKIKLKRKNWKNNFQEKFVFNLNDKISNFGQSYLRPIGWILFFAVLYYFIIDWNYRPWELINKNNVLNDIAKNVIPFAKILKEGMEFTSLIFYVIFSTLVWQTVVALKRLTRR